MRRTSVLTVSELHPSDIMLAVEQILLADQQTRKCTGNITKTNEYEFIVHEFSVVTLNVIKWVGMETRGGHAGLVEKFGR